MLGVHCSCTCLCPVQHLTFNVLSGEQKFIFLFYDFLFKVTIECANITISMLVIRQKGKSQNRWFKKTKLAKFPKKQTNVCFSGNLACFVFLKHAFWDSPFCLITGEIKVINVTSTRSRFTCWKTKMCSFRVLLLAECSWRKFIFIEHWVLWIENEWEL